METLRDRGDAVVYRGAARRLGAPAGSVLDRVRERGQLRVGYFEDSLPFVFTNARGNLVGFDVDMALQLASDLGVRLELVPADAKMLTTGLEADSYDLLMSGVPVTADRAMSVLFTTSYLDETLAFLVLDHRRAEFSSWDAIRAQPGLRIGVPAVPYYLKKIHAELPNASIMIVDGGPQIPREAIARARRACPHGRTRLGVHAAPSPVLGRRAAAASAQDSARLRGRRTRSAVREPDRRVDRPEAQGRHDRRTVRALDPGDGATTAKRRWSIMDDVLGWEASGPGIPGDLRQAPGRQTPGVARPHTKGYSDKRPAGTP